MVDDLIPIPFPVLVERLAGDLAGGQAVYGLPRRDWWTPRPDLDLGLAHLGRRPATPVGPASGPHTQLAQNLVLSWLAGGRFMELKTVQVLDRLEIPRPCIHAPHVGYNVEWSQELRIPQSAEEYVKGWMLVHFLAAALGQPEPACVFDLSLGYDLDGIRSERVAAFVAEMADAGERIERLRAELPRGLPAWTRVPVPARVADSVTLSTFHGCPAGEIEAIARHLLDQGLHTVVKLNPTLLGHDRCRGLLDAMGYDAIALDPQDFARDLQWAQLLEMAPRLGRHAAARGLGFGFKLSNTLVCRSDEPPFRPGEIYLSGPPLHVLAITLAAELREALGPEVPITFSAGVDAGNLPDCVAAGLGPVTSCTDLLKGRGYGRLAAQLRALEDRMEAEGVADLAALRGRAGPGALARLAEAARGDPRYGRAANARPPRKVGSRLDLLDCLTCDKCIPVCPNGANFRIPLPRGTLPGGVLRWEEGRWTALPGEPLPVRRRHQIGTLADACNLCGQCDPWCPEDGGPHLVKPNLFLSRRAFEEHPERDGLHVADGGRTLWWRWRGRVLRYRRGEGPAARLEVPGGHLDLDAHDRVVGCGGGGELPAWVPALAGRLLDALLAPGAGSWLTPSALQR